MKEEWMVIADGYLLWIAAALLLMLLVLAALWHDLMHHKVRIYNWDGKRYRFLGRARLRKKNDRYVVNMRERMGEMSFTTRYLLLASDKFVKKHRYESLLFCAGRNEAWLPVEERMRAEALYAYRRKTGLRFD